MSDVIDSWETGKPTDLLRYKVTLYADTDSTPGDYDCYDAEDVKRWKNDEWRFVGVEVYPIIRDWELTSVGDSLWGVEWGVLGGEKGVEIDRTYIQDLHPVPDMVKEIDIRAKLLSLMADIRKVVGE